MFSPSEASTWPTVDADHRHFACEDLEQWVTAAVQASATALQSAALKRAVSADREHTADVLALLQARRTEFSDVLARELRAEILAPPIRPASAAAPRQRLELTLVDEDRIDEQIEVARVVQAIESCAEWELSRVAALYSRLAGRDGISPDANPLQPAAVARGMRRSLTPFGLSKPARLLLLRELGEAASQQLRIVYRTQAARMEAAGVQPLGFTVRASAGAASQGIRQAVRRSLEPSRQAVAPAGDAPASMAAAQGSLARLVAWAQREDLPAAGAGGDAAIRLLDAGHVPGEPPSMDEAAAVRVMERLFALLISQDSLSARAKDLVQQLDPPARRLAAGDPDLWRSLKHPWWQLLDRVVSVGSVQEEVGTAVAGSSLDRVVERLAQSPRPDAAQCRRALAEADFVITGLLDERNLALAPEANALQQQVDRDTLERHLREQIVEQLRSMPSPARLRQFLLGPWAIALADAAVRHGEDSDELRQRADLVDALIAACCSAAAPADAARRARLIERAQDGLAAAQFSEPRIQAELADLGEALLRPGVPDDSEIVLPPQPLPVGHVLSLHDGLPTVPIDTVETDAPGPGTSHRQAWLDGLEPGDYCRLFLLERWMTTQLTWRSQNRGMFVFTSRHAGRLHSLTRRALEKLRSAGLAATIEHGQLIAQAMDALTDSSV